MNDPEHVLIGLSGVADPLPVAQTTLDPYVREFLELDSLAGVADNRHLWTTLRDNPEGAVQLDYANTVTLNKADLASTGQLKTTRALLTVLNPLAEVYETAHATVHPVHVLNGRAFDPAQLGAGLRTVQHTKGLSLAGTRAL